MRRFVLSIEIKNNNAFPTSKSWNCIVIVLNFFLVKTTVSLEIFEIMISFWFSFVEPIKISCKNETEKFKQKKNIRNLILNCQTNLTRYFSSHFLVAFLIIRFFGNYRKNSPYFFGSLIVSIWMLCIEKIAVEHGPHTCVCAARVIITKSLNCQNCRDFAKHKEKLPPFLDKFNLLLENKNSVFLVDLSSKTSTSKSKKWSFKKQNVLNLFEG